MDKHVTAVVIVVEADLKELEGLGKLAESEDYIADLKFSGINWFYHSLSGRRVLLALLQKQTIKDIRGLAGKVASALQA